MASVNSPPNLSLAADLRYIVVEGPIGVGKTSLARRLAESFESDLVLENAEENPFLERFYRNRRHSALPTQLFFLFQRARQIEAIRQTDLFSPVRVADFMLDKDRLFAELNLDANELNLYEQVYQSLEIDPPTPDLVIYLQAPPSVLRRRVVSRGIPYEQQLDEDYLERLGNAYAKFFYEFEAAPLLIVNAAHIDPVHREADYQELLRAICRIKHGRHFFNPAIETFA
ncbi:MAG: deoxynucleoside kinase [Gammaproteobacteria bacterium]|nr:deoxynucleoside kinase [Gammaproteobacteria bacterium]MDH3509152.1 deoxynucleoside kinase [Gammaproteobacteria bacterium]